MDGGGWDRADERPLIVLARLSRLRFLLRFGSLVQTKQHTLQ